jgi:hypothetical protein
MVAAYAFVLQLLLTGVAAAQVAAGKSPEGDLFVICHGGDGPAGDQNGPGKTPLAQSPCALCTLTSAPCAILPGAHAVSTADLRSSSDVVISADDRIIRSDSPGRQYQRGPPAFARISG